MSKESEIDREVKSIRLSLARIERLLEDTRLHDFENGFFTRHARNKELAPLLKAVAKAESNFNPTAVSHAGAEGLMQLMPAIQKHFGVDDPYDPIQSVHAAEKLLEEELARFGDLHLALAAYNAGSPRVTRALLLSGGDDWRHVKDHLPAETRAYVPRVISLYQMYRAEDPIVA